MMQAIGLTKQFQGVTAVSEVNFTLSPGERVALIGANGAGKSSLFGLLGGQVRPTRGTLLLDQRPITHCSPQQRHRLGIGRTFQQAAVWPALTVAENLALAAANPFSWRRLRISPADLPVPLRGLAHSRCDELAYADLKRVELALVLVQRPRILLLDEPTAGMGAQERQALFSDVEAYLDTHEAGLLFTEHDLSAVFAHATRLMVLHHGRLIADGPTATVQQDVAVRRAYLGDEPL